MPKNSTNAIDVFVEDFASEVLLRGRFTKFSRRLFRRELPHGLLIVEFRSDDQHHQTQSTGFNCVYGVVSNALLKFRESRGLPRPRTPTASDALLRASLPHPGWVEGDRSDHFPYRWLISDDPDGRHDMGEYLRKSLDADVLPVLRSWSTPAGLVAGLLNRTRLQFPGMTPLGRAVAVAALDEGATERARQACSRLPPGDEVRDWIEGELALK